MADRRARVAIIATGGTIESVGRDRLDLAWYLESGQERLGSGALLEAIPELALIAQVENVPFRRLSSHALSNDDWLDLARMIQELQDTDRADGVVVTHGTNTLEETAYFLTLTLKTEVPVVLVGAMRPSSGLSADGYLNLVNAIRVAAEPSSRAQGVLVVLNDAILSARDVTKTATYRLDAFQGRDLGPLGYADADGRVVYYHAPTRRHTASSAFDIRALASLPRVDVVLSYVGADGVAIDAAVRAGAAGIVCAATGAGHPTPPQTEALRRAQDQGVIVCIASRVGSGRVARSPGMAQRGLVAADNLQPWKARVLLSLALTSSHDPEVIQHLFDTH